MRAEELKDVKTLLYSYSCYVSLATCDGTGRVDVAPVGSTFMPSPDTIACLRGPMGRSASNLRENPEAVFLLANVSRARLLKLFLTGRFGASYGYRVHARLREERPISDEEKGRILGKRFGPLARGKGARRIAGLLHRIMVFDVLDVREVAVPSGGAR